MMSLNIQRIPINTCKIYSNAYGDNFDLFYGQQAKGAFKVLLVRAYSPFLVLVQGFKL